MATYIAYISINDTDGRSKNFTTAPTITVWNGRTKAAITTPSPTLTNITTGLYSVDIELATKTDVLFKIVPHVDDEDDIADIKVIHEEYIETVETMGNGVTLTSAYDAAKTAASQSSVNAIPTTPLLAANYTAPDNAGITSIKNKTDNLPAVPAAKSDIPSVSDIATAVWGAVTRTLTALPAMAADWITALGIKSDAVTKLQSGIAKTSELPTGYATETNATANKTDILDAIDEIDGGGGSGATPAEIWSHATRTLTASPTDISGLETATNAAARETAIKLAITNKAVTPPTDISNLPTKTDLEEVQDNIISAMPDIDISTIPDDILSTVVVDDMTVAQVLKVLSAVEVGTVSGGGGATFSYTGKDGTKITLSGVDENGNRAAVNVEFE